MALGGLGSEAPSTDDSVRCLNPSERLRATSFSQLRIARFSCVDVSLEGVQPAAAAGTVPNLLSLEWNSFTAFCRSTAVKSGQRRSVKYSSA